jgi:hypothetical protein
MDELNELNCDEVLSVRMSALATIAAIAGALSQGERFQFSLQYLAATLTHVDPYCLLHMVE